MLLYVGSDGSKGVVSVEKKKRGITIFIWRNGKHKVCGENAIFGSALWFLDQKDLKWSLQEAPSMRVPP